VTRRCRRRLNSSPGGWLRTEVLLSRDLPGFAAQPWAQREAILRSIGLPTDLLDYWMPANGTTADASNATDRPAASTDSPALARQVRAAIAAGMAEHQIVSDAAAMRFVFRPTVAGYRAAAESGGHDIGLVRLQASSGSYYQGPGDGGCLDMFRQLLAALPEARFVISIERKHLDGFLSAAGRWAIARRAETCLVVEDAPLSQWAQDNGKAGVITDGGVEQPFTLVPRFASRGEAGSIFVPGDSFACEGAARAGLAYAQSPLLFQGGNLLVAHDAARDRRVLLVGEAEIWRNTALGLSESEARAAFAVEFACDEVVVLPAVSHHIDYEVSVRDVGGRTVALVNDDLPAALQVVRLCLARLAAAAPADDEMQRAASQFDSMVAGGQIQAAAQRVAEALSREAAGPGRWPAALADRLATEPGDSGVGNFNVFMAAADILLTAGATEADFPGEHHASAYFRSLCRRRVLRSRLGELLRQQGWEVTAIPSIADGEQSVCYLNGVHARGRFLMPVYGGLFAPLDRMAAEAVGRALGSGVEVVPIRSGESLRRDGAVHCSLAAYPAK
jgi:hypothetical protein